MEWLLTQNIFHALNLKSKMNCANKTKLALLVFGMQKNIENYLQDSVE